MGSTINNKYFFQSYGLLASHYDDDVAASGTDMSDVAC